ncbi:MAG: hypothetical protein U0X71_05650 [Sphingobacteriaceae bacterium]|jgi:hypothetical protein|nr:MAG: hypothetical protein E6Q66_01415 [Pedobacter sp.]
MIYEIGGNEIKVDASEGINSIANNRTLIAQKLTDKAPTKPEVVEGLTTVEAVFEHFKPSVNVEMETEEGMEVKETIGFTNVGDFNPKSLIERSAYLNEVNDRKSAYVQILKQIKTNKVLQKIINSPENKAALLSALEELVAELDKADK